MNKQSPSLRFVAPLLCGLLLLLASPVRANIALQDGSVTYTHQTATAISKAFTVTAGANVLVVTLADRNAQAGYPASLSWNGSQTIARVITATANASTYRNVAIYSLYNPTPGSGNITGTGSGTSDIWLAAYTLNGVQTNIAALTGSASNTAASSLTFTVAGVQAGSWAAVVGAYANNTSSPVFAITGTGGTATTSTDIADNGTPVTMGYVANLSAGTNTLTYALTAGGVTAQKTEFAAVIFPPISFSSPPSITTQPQPSIVYTNVTATFTAAANGFPAPVYYWQKNGVNLADGSNISGSTNATLTVSNVSASDVAGYAMVASNLNKAVTSSVATITIVAPVEPYEQAVANLHPVAFYQFNDVNDPATNNAESFDYAGGFNGTYGNKVQNGNANYNVQGPSSGSSLPGFSSTNLAASFSQAGHAAGNYVQVPAWNFSGNSVTFTAWMNPGGVQNTNTGVVFSRGTTVVAGLDYFGSFTNNDVPLGYTWNNEPDTTSWSSGLVPPAGQWSLVALVVSPTAATIYVMNTSGLTSSTHTYPHAVESFNATSYIGEDNGDGLNGSRSFLGQIDDVAVFNSALTADQVAGLFYVASGVTNYAPVIGDPPVSQSVYAGQTVQFYAGADGSDPVTYQWAAGTSSSGGSYTNLTDGVNGVSGSHTATLTIANVNANDALDYVVTVANSAGYVSTSNSPANPATLSVNAPNAPILNITMAAQQASGDDWDHFTVTNIDKWNDGQGGLPASVSAVEFPGSVYEILPGARLRSPTGSDHAVFPGVKLLLDGTGFVNNPAGGTTQGELRFKQPQPANGDNASVTFPLLVFNGGQLDLGSDTTSGGSQSVIVNGVINVLSNGIFYSDSGDDRGYIINAQLTGTNGIQYNGDAIAYPQTYTNLVIGGVTNSANIGGYTNGLIIACTSNTFSGPWSDNAGMLLGATANCLGTNSITVLSNGVFQTLYDIHNSNANLVLNGKMFLTQNDTFSNVVLGASALPVGTYTAAQLCSNYPAFFPTNWILHAGAGTQTNATGSLTVLNFSGASIVQNPTPSSITLYPAQTAQFTALGGGDPNYPLSYRWQFNGTNLTDGTTLAYGTNLHGGAIIVGSLTNSLTLSNLVAGQAGTYTIIVSNSLGSVTSAPAFLTILPTYPAESIQLNLALPGNSFEPSGFDWNSGGVWNDTSNGLPASVSSLVFPGSTYEVVPGSLLRTPAANVPFTSFPGAQLTVDGTGVWSNNPAAAGSPQGEIRFKQGTNGEVNYFPLLIMAGGQLDNGNGGTSLTAPSISEIAGNMEIISNTPIYANDSGAVGFRPWQIDAYLFGNGNIEYHDSDATLGGGLYITGTTNAYTGTWDIVTGPLVGGGTNSLGTNNITIEAAGVLETLYDVHSSNALLNLNLGARVFLHQNDTFKSMIIGGTPVAAGIYTNATLEAQFPATFPATWTPVFGSTVSNASGSITVLTTLVLPPVIASQPPTNAAEFAGAKVTYTVAAGGSPGTYQWYTNGVLAAGATGSSYTFTAATGTNSYSVVVSNSAGVTSNMISTNIATMPPVTVTFADTQNWTTEGLNTTPVNDGTTLTLTDNNVSEAASAFYGIAQYIEGFDASFTYEPSGQLAADGITFCVQNAAAGPAALGANGGNLGYFGITNSAAFEINIYGGATGGVGIGFGTNGQIALPFGPVTNSNPASSVNLTNGNGDTFNVNLYYNGATMQVILEDTMSLATYVTNFAVGDLGAVVGDSVGYIGFTGGTGGSTSIQQITNFKFVPVAQPVLTMINDGGGNFTLSWSAGSLTNLNLQQSAALNGPWTDVGVTTNTVGTQFQVNVTPGVSSQFYRLGLQ